MKIAVMDMQGSVHNFDIPASYTIDRVKELCMPKITTGPVKCESAHAIGFKLVNPSSGRRLREGCSLEKEGVNDRDELLLVRSRPCHTSGRGGAVGAFQIAVDDAAIEKATEKAPVRNAAQQRGSVASSVSFSGFPSEFRNILMTLINASHRILCYNPDAVKMFREALDGLQVKRKKEQIVDETALLQLIDMGFDRARAKQALLLNNMSAIQAMECLLEQEDISEPSPDVPAEPARAEDTALAPLGDDADGMAVFRRFRELSFRPDERIVAKLTHMGFKRPEILDALRVIGNNQDLACDWLLGARKPSVEEFEQGLGRESPFYKAIMKNPTIQVGLTNPKNLFAFEDMLEHPNSINDYLKDPDANPILLQVSCIYQTAKQSLPDVGASVDGSDSASL